MQWLNVFGLVFICAIMIPNIILALKQKHSFENKYQNKTVEIIEQIGRCACICFMIFNIPKTYLGWCCEKAFVFYLIINSLLVVLYYVIWILCWHKNIIFKALSLSFIPSALFLFSGIMCRSAPLVISSLIFMPTHILISYKNIK